MTGDATYPTVYTESVLITATIDAYEGRDAGICNILGAFLSADMDKDAKMALCGSLAELMVKLAPQIYIHHMIYEKGWPVLYVILNKSLYSCLRSGLLFYERLVADMRGKGFELNPYYPCVANKMIGGKKMILYWNVYDLKVSHVDPKEITNFMEWI